CNLLNQIWFIGMIAILEMEEEIVERKQPRVMPVILLFQTEHPVIQTGIFGEQTQMQQVVHLEINKGWILGRLLKVIKLPLILMPKLKSRTCTQKSLIQLTD